MIGKSFIDIVPQKGGSNFFAARALHKLAKKALYVGFFEDSDKNKRSSDLPGINPTNADIAIRNEYGVPEERIPPRPFLVPGVADGVALVSPAIGTATKAMVDGDEQGFTKTMNAVGESIVETVREYILDSSHFEPNAPLTLELKKPEDRPLIHTQQMLNAVESRLVEE